MAGEIQGRTGPYKIVTCSDIIGEVIPGQH